MRDYKTTTYPRRKTRTDYVLMVLALYFGGFLLGLIYAWFMGEI